MSENLFCDECETPSTCTNRGCQYPPVLEIAESVLSEAARLVDGQPQRRDVLDSNLYAKRPERLLKLHQHDHWARLAIDHLADWLHGEAELLAAVAKGRHAEGSLRYGDRLMYEYTQDELLAEASQELGDAINYLALWLARNAELVDEQ